jgi:hypothetical protein
MEIRASGSAVSHRRTQKRLERAVRLRRRGFQPPPALPLRRPRDGLRPGLRPLMPAAPRATDSSGWCSCPCPYLVTIRTHPWDAKADTGQLWRLRELQPPSVQTSPPTDRIGGCAYSSPWPRKAVLPAMSSRSAWKLSSRGSPRLRPRSSTRATRQRRLWSPAPRSPAPRPVPGGLHAEPSLGVEREPYGLRAAAQEGEDALGNGPPHGEVAVSIRPSRSSRRSDPAARAATRGRPRSD